MVIVVASIPVVVDSLLLFPVVVVSIWWSWVRLVSVAVAEG